MNIERKYFILDIDWNSLANPLLLLRPNIENLSCVKYLISAIF